MPRPKGLAHSKMTRAQRCCAPKTSEKAKRWRHKVAATNRGDEDAGMKPGASLAVLCFHLPLFHAHHPPGRWVLPVQLCRLRNQLLHSRPFYVGHAPQLYASHELRLALQQFLGIAKRC